VLNCGRTHASVIGDAREELVDRRVALVLAYISGEPTPQAEPGHPCRHEVARWYQRFVQAGRLGLQPRPWPRPGEQGALRAENQTLNGQLRRIRASAEMWKNAAGGVPGPFEALEAIRQDAGMPISRFCLIVGIPRRTYMRRLARLRQGRRLDAPRHAYAVELCLPILARYVAAHPGCGHRQLHARMLADGHMTSESTVLRTLRIIRQRGGPPAVPSSDCAEERRTPRTADDPRRETGP
jgi:hypothetical protein